MLEYVSKVLLCTLGRTSKNFDIWIAPADSTFGFRSVPLLGIYPHNLDHTDGGHSGGHCMAMARSMRCHIEEDDSRQEALSHFTVFRAWTTTQQMQFELILSCLLLNFEVDFGLGKHGEATAMKYCWLVPNKGSWGTRKGSIHLEFI